MFDNLSFCTVQYRDKPNLPVYSCKSHSLKENWSVCIKKCILLNIRKSLTNTGMNSGLRIITQAYY